MSRARKTSKSQDSNLHQDQKLNAASGVPPLRSVEELRSVLDALFIFVGLFSTDGAFLGLNKRPLELAELRREDVIGKKVWETYWFSRSAEARDRVRLGMQRAAQGETVRYEDEVCIAGGQRMMLDITLSPLRDESGKVVQIVGSGVDISPREEALAALAVSEERLRLAVESSNTGLWEWEPSGLAYLSPTWKRLLGYADDEIPNRFEEWSSRIHPDDLPRMMASVEAHAKNPPQGWEDEFRIRHKDGSYRWFLARAAAQCDEQGRLKRLLGANIDITERKEAESAIRNSEELLELFIEHAPAALAMFDREMRHIRVSRRWRTSYVPGDRNPIGVSHDEIYGEIPEDWREAHRRGLRGEVVQGDGRFERSDGSLRWVGWEVRPWHDRTGEIGGIVIFSEDVTDRKRAEAALRDSEARLRTALEAAMMSPFERDLLTGEAHWTPTTEAMYGFAPGTSPSALEDLVRLIHPQDREHFWHLVRESTESGVGGGEWRVIWPDGSIHWISSRWRVFKDDQGRPSRAIGVDYDITERKQAEEQLRLSEERYRSLVEATSEQVWTGNVVDGETVVPSWLELTGQTPEQAREHWPDAVHPEDREAMVAAWSRFLKEGGLYEVECRLRRGEEPYRWYFFRGVPVRERDGSIRERIGTYTDITERKQAEEVLRSSEERMRLAQQVAQIGAFERNMQTGEGIWTRETERMFGLRPGEGPKTVEGFLNLIHPEDRLRVEQLFAESIAASEAAAEWRVIWPDGSVHWIDGRWRVFKDEQGRPLRFIGIDTDITERKQAEESLRAQTEQLRALTIRLQQVREEERTMVARDLHDQIGQILTAIKMDCDWVTRRLTSHQDAELSKRLAASLERIKEATQSLRSICTRLRPGVLDDLGLAAAMEWQLKEFATVTGIQCDISVPQEVFPLDAHRRTAIFRILQEALTNVARHAQAKMVRASLTQQGDKLVLVVQDDGKGITEKEVEDSRTSLGLLGMKERAEACGGEMQIWGDPGKGTTLAVQIPLSDSSGQGGNGC